MTLPKTDVALQNGPRNTSLDLFLGWDVTAVWLVHPSGQIPLHLFGSPHEVGVLSKQRPNEHREGALRSAPDFGKPSQLAGKVNSSIPLSMRNHVLGRSHLGAPSARKEAAPTRSPRVEASRHRPEAFSGAPLECEANWRRSSEAGSVPSFRSVAVRPPCND